MTPYNSRKGYVYFLHCPLLNAIKVGFSFSAPLMRWRSFATTFPYPVICLGWCDGNLKAEREWHNKFSKSALLNEWFLWSPKIIKQIKSACPNYGRDHMADQFPPISKAVRTKIYNFGHEKVAKKIGVPKDDLFKWCLKTGTLPPEKINEAIKFYHELP